MRRALLVLLLVAACGKQGELTRRVPPGQTPVLDPTRAPPSKLLEVPTQARPARVDDPVRRSEERRDDRFDVPPP